MWRTEDPTGELLVTRFVFCWILSTVRKLEARIAELEAQVERALTVLGCPDPDDD